MVIPSRYNHSQLICIIFPQVTKGPLSAFDGFLAFSEIININHIQQAQKARADTECHVGKEKLPD